jgi:hypothetical protein
MESFAMSYAVLRDAIVNKKQVSCVYRGLAREICPHVIGRGKDGHAMVLSFQFGGQSSSSLPPGGEWRCMRVDEITNTSSRAGPWHTGDNHNRPQTCVKDVDVEVDY